MPAVAVADALARYPGCETFHPIISKHTMRRFKTAILVLVFCYISLAINAQTGRLYVLSEGTTPAGGSLGYIEYNGAGTVYTELAAVAAYGSILLVDGCEVYVADGAGDVLVFNKVNGAALDTLSVGGARQMVRYNDWLLVTSSAAPYFQVFDVQNGYAPVFQLDATKVRTAAEGIALVGDTAFVAINEFGTDSGLVAISLLTQDTLAVIDVATNPNSVIAHNGQLFVQCLDYFGTDGLTVSVVDAATLVETRRDVTGKISYGLFELANDEIYFQYSDFTTPSLGAYSTANGLYSLGFIPGGFYAAEYLDLGGSAMPFLFLSQTDFTTFGQVVRYNGTSALDTVATPIAPRSVYFQAAPVGLEYTLVDINGDTLVSGDTLYADAHYILIPKGIVQSAELDFGPMQDNVIAGALPNSVTFQLQGVPGMDFLISLLSDDDAGCLYGFAQSYVLEVLTATPEAQWMEAVEMYPNPASSSLTINHLPVGATVSWADALGRSVAPTPLSSNPTTQVFDVQALPSGLYFVTLQTGHETATRRVVVQ